MVCKSLFIYPWCLNSSLDVEIRTSKGYPKEHKPKGKQGIGGTQTQQDTQLSIDRKGTGQWSV